MANQQPTPIPSPSLYGDDDGGVGSFTAVGDVQTPLIAWLVLSGIFLGAFLVVFCGCIPSVLDRIKLLSTHTAEDDITAAAAAANPGSSAPPIDANVTVIDPERNEKVTEMGMGSNAYNSSMGMVTPSAIHANIAHGGDRSDVSFPHHYFSQKLPELLGINRLWDGPVFSYLEQTQVFGQALHTVAVNDNTVTILVSTKKFNEARLGLPHTPHVMEKSLQGNVEVASVPVRGITHVTMRMAWATLGIFQRAWIRLKQLWYYLEVMSPYLSALCIYTALSVSFFVPSTQQTSLGTNPATAQLVKAIFSLVISATFFHLLTAFWVARRSNWKNVISIIVFASIPVLFLALFLIGGTYSVAAGSYGDSQPAPAVSASFSCSCPKAAKSHPSPAPKNNYECVASSFNGVDVGCPAHCSVCGSTFYGPFVSFTLFAFFYALSALFIAFFHFFVRSVTNATPPEFSGVRFMRVKLHGRAASGFPLYTSLSLEQAAAFESVLSEKRAHMESDEKYQPNFAGMLSSFVVDFSNSRLTRWETSPVYPGPVHRIWEFWDNFCAGLIGLPHL